MKNILKSILACVLTALLIAGASWAATLIPVSQGGTGASTASGARSNLGLGTIATQNVGTLTNTKYCTYATGTGFVCNSDGIGSMTYPDAGIALSTGSGWDTSIANNSANWNTAYEWGNHASAGYLTSLSGALLATGATTGATSQAQAFTNGVITGKIYPSADSTTALQFNKADGTTNILNIDTTNGNVGIGTTSPTARLHLAAGTATASTAPLKFTSGTLLTAPEAGAVEFDGTNLYFTPAAARKIIAFTDSNITGNAGTATALAADPADCAAGTVATAINASGTLTCGITPLISGGTLTSSNVCQYDGTGIDCNLTQDSTGACAAGAVCLGGHTHATTELSGVNAGTDLTADLEEEAHAAEHAVSAADTVFPADPGADRYLMWDDDPGALAWGSPAGSGDVESVGDCAGGACLDGTTDGGTYIKFYDAQGAGQLITGNLTEARTWTLPDSTGTLVVGTPWTGEGYLTANQSITLSGDVSGSGQTSITTTIGNDKILEAHLKAVDAASDEECLTYESTTGDFEWQSCSTGIAADDIDTSAELLAILTDETGTGLLVFNNSPTFADDITIHATGVKLTGDGDGALTILGLGDGYDEDLTLNLDDTENTLVLSSSTGLATIDIGTMALEIDEGKLTDSTIVSADIKDGTITAADTAITAGRSLTWSTNDMAADAELYTDTKCIYFEDPTADDDFKSIWFAKQAATITSMWCESDQTVNMDLQVDDGSPADVNGTDLVCDTTPPEDTSMGGDATLASGDRLDLAITSVSGTPTWVSICWTFTYDD